jgi:hypothetical protein
MGEFMGMSVLTLLFWLGITGKLAQSFFFLLLDPSHSKDSLEPPKRQFYND